jgi:hypothetical protein
VSPSSFGGLPRIARTMLRPASSSPSVLAREFSRTLCGYDSPGHTQIGEFTVAPLTVMTINDLEILEYSVREFSLGELLRDYSLECPDRFMSLHNFMASGLYRMKWYLTLMRYLGSR